MFGEGGKCARGLFHYLATGNADPEAKTAMNTPVEHTHKTLTNDFFIVYEPTCPACYPVEARKMSLLRDVECMLIRAFDGEVAEENVLRLVKYVFAPRRKTIWQRIKQGWNKFQW